MKEVVIFKCANKKATFNIGKFSITFLDNDWDAPGSTFATSNTEEIEALKNSVYFKRGIISLVPIKRKKAKAASKSKKATEVPKMQEYPDVKRVQDAIIVIKNICAKRDVVCPGLRTKQQVLDMAAKLNITFPSFQ